MAQLARLTRTVQVFEKKMETTCRNFRLFSVTFSCKVSWRMTPDLEQDIRDYNGTSWQQLTTRLTSLAGVWQRVNTNPLQTLYLLCLSSLFSYAHNFLRDYRHRCCFNRKRDRIKSSWKRTMEHRISRLCKILTEINEYRLRENNELTAPLHSDSIEETFCDLQSLRNQFIFLNLICGKVDRSDQRMRRT